MPKTEAELRRDLGCDRNNLYLAYQLGEALLRRGDFRPGWFYRDHNPKKYLPHPDGVPPWLWRGEDLAGRTLLVFPEEGYGDMIQYFPLFGRLAAAGAKVIFQAPRAVHRLFSLNAPPGVTFLVWEDQSDHKTGFSADYYCALTSMPGLMGIARPDIPLGVTYLKPASDDTSAWHARLAGDERPRIGVAWRGNPKHVNDANRSIPIAAFAALFDLNCRFCSLQVGVDPAQAQLYGIYDGAPFIKDFGDTAACLETLDAVVTVDTALAHLAGAMGVPTFVLIGEPSDWRWGLPGAEPPWYPSVHVLRQDDPGDWSVPVTAAKAVLMEMIAGRTLL